MKKLRFFVFGAILAVVSVVTSSSMNPSCGDGTGCPSGMTCVNNKCITQSGEGDKIPCYSELHKSDKYGVVECSSCTFKEGWTKDVFTGGSQCTRGNGPQ